MMARRLTLTRAQSVMCEVSEVTSNVSHCTTPVFQSSCSVHARPPDNASAAVVEMAGDAHTPQISRSRAREAEACDRQPGQLESLRAFAKRARGMSLCYVQQGRQWSPFAQEERHADS